MTEQQSLQFSVEDEIDSLWVVKGNTVRVVFHENKELPFEDFSFDDKSKFVNFVFDNLLFIEHEGLISDNRALIRQIIESNLISLEDLKDESVTALDLERLESLGLLTKEEVDELMLA